MEDLINWAQQNNVPLIDGIHALDHNRDYLTSWVHLKPEGNLILANEIAKKILADYHCDE
jgi:hypothetical protein